MCTGAGLLLKNQLNPVLGALICEVICGDSLLADFELCPLAREDIKSVSGDGLYIHTCFYWCDSGYKWKTRHTDCFKTETCIWERWRLVTNAYKIE